MLAVAANTNFQEVLYFLFYFILAECSHNWLGTLYMNKVGLELTDILKPQNC